MDEYERAIQAVATALRSDSAAAVAAFNASLVAYGLPWRLAKRKELSNPGNHETWPAWLRSRDICSTPDYAGPYPGTQAQWWREVHAGRVPQPQWFAKGVACWRKEDVLKVTGNPPIGQTA